MKENVREIMSLLVAGGVSTNVFYALGTAISKIPMIPVSILNDEERGITISFIKLIKNTISNENDIESLAEELREYVEMKNPKWQYYTMQWKPIDNECFDKYRKENK